MAKKVVKEKVVKKDAKAILVQEGVEEITTPLDTQSIEEVLADVVATPDTIHGKKVLTVTHEGGLHQIKDIEGTGYTLPSSEYDLWARGELFV